MRTVISVDLLPQGVTKQTRLSLARNVTFSHLAVLPIADTETRSQTYRETNLLNNMGLLHLLTGEYNQAVLTLDRTVSCARQIAYTRAQAYALCTLGDVYAELEATDAALEVYHLADEIVQRIGERFLLLHLQLARAALHRSHGDIAGCASERVQIHPASSAQRVGTRGPFLPGIYSEWVLPERERLQHVFIEAALALAELYLDTRQYKAALETCQRILVQDPFAG